jgi:hypothetical protein
MKRKNIKNTKKTKKPKNNNTHNPKHQLAPNIKIHHLLNHKLINEITSKPLKQDKLNVLTFNTSGFKTDPDKVKAIIQYIKSLNQGNPTIICLQECHNDQILINSLIAQLPSFNVYAGDDSSISGVITIIHKSINSCIKYKSQRLLSTEITLKDFNFIIHNIYAEAKNPLKVNFWHGMDQII